MGLTDLVSLPAFWGGCGACVYAGTQLTADLWGGEAPPPERAKKKAVAKFGLAVFFGPIAATAITGPLIGFTGGRATIPAMALAVGLCCNGLWPVLVDGLGREVRRAVGGMLKRLGAAISNGEPDG